MKIIILAMVAAVMVSSCKCKHNNLTVEQMVEEAKSGVTFISPKNLNELMQSEEIYTIIDVRQKSEYYHGYIPGAIVIPRGSLEFRIGSAEFWDNEGLYMPDKKEKIILYCKKGDRAILAAKTLKSMGYTNIQSLEGGWKNWELSFPDIFEKALDMLNGSNLHENTGGGC